MDDEKLSEMDEFMGTPNPIVSCPKCGYKQRWFEAKLNCHSFDRNGLVTGCLGCDLTFEEFINPPEIIEHTLEGHQFRMSMNKYEPYFRDILIEKIQNYEGDETGHERVAKIMDEVGMSAVDKYGGLRDIHRKFLESLAYYTEDADRKAKYQAEIDRREASKKRKKKPKTDEEPTKIKWNPKKPKAGERIGEGQRGWHQDYYGR
jgi:hypothetical protein